MVMDDTESKRKIFFYAYTISAIILYIMGIYTAYNKFEEQTEDPNAFVKECENIQKAGKLESFFNAKTIKECQNHIKNVGYTLTCMVFVFFAIA